MKRSDAKFLLNRKHKLEACLHRGAAFKSPSYNLDYEVSGRVCGAAYGGVAAMIELARATGLGAAIDSHVSVLSEHRPYRESDHVLAIVASILAGGTCIEDMRRVRQDGAFLDSLGMNRFPDSTTAGDFLRRFSKEDVQDLMNAGLSMTEQVLRNKLPMYERGLGIIDGDGTIAQTDAECMEGIDYCGYKRKWGYAPLLISLANTQQPLCVVNRPGNAPSAQDAAHYFDMAAESMLRVFDRLLLRGDTDFSQTKHLDRWHYTGRIDFVFGYDACPALKSRAEALEKAAWREFKRAECSEKTTRRRKPQRVKQQIVAERGYRDLHLVREDIAEFEYQPTACCRPYRMVVIRKQIEVVQGQLEIQDQTRYFFYITNMRDVAAETIVSHANKRCNQENLIAQLSGQVHALSTTSDTLLSNWAWMVIASLAWTLKSWFALFAREPAQRKCLLGMEFRSFLSRFIAFPVQIVRSARRTILRILGGNLPSIPIFLNIWADIRRLRRIRV